MEYRRITMKFQKTLYNIAKWACLVGMPGVVVLIATLGSIWGWDWAPQICASISAIDTCLGTFIGISSGKEAKKTDGDVVIDENGNIIDITADEPGKNIVDGKDVVKLSVKKESDDPYGLK